MMRLASLLIVAALCGCESAEDAGLAACDAAIQETLKAPASYKRVSVSGPSGAWEIQYDAVNSFNAPLRAKGTCFYSGRKPAVWMPKAD